MLKRNRSFYIGIVLIISGMCFFPSCKKELPVNIPFEAYIYSSVDENGGNWQPVYLTSNSLVFIPAPSDVTSAEYLAELGIVKGYNENLTSAQQAAVDYWGNNSIIRWIEIASELAAKYNLPASPDGNDDYGVADPVFPANYPNFPFAHPPYTSRMFAYLTAAMYDALITSWHYKYLYNRQAPYKVDSSLIPGYPDNNIPSYPSEDAVIASVAQTVLIYMFPLESEYINEKADELRNTRLWAGMNVQSDIDKGDSIGFAIANIFIGRAKNDSMKYALVDEEEYKTIEDNADALWGSQWPHWENLEVPQRPIGITPKFGRVFTWWIPSVESVRPGPPPAVGSPEYEKAVNELKNYSKYLSNERKQIAFFWADGGGTYTPAGHWNWIADQSIVNNKLNPLRTARVLAYLNTAMMDAGISCWDTKYYYMYPRPPQADPGINTLFMLPNFPSYTSGHSTFSGAASAVLSYFFPGEAATFNEWSQQASESRIYARIHFRFDCDTGLVVGNSIGNYAVTAAKADGSDN